MTALPANPSPAFSVPEGRGPLAAIDALRFATSDDLPFLRQLYRSFRLDDLAPLPWSTEEKHTFIDQQFDMQHRYYMAAFARADFLIIELDGLAIGRLYIDASGDRWHIIDIGLLPEWRNRGFGRALLQEIQKTAAAGTAKSVILHVEQMNIRAQTLYQTLGFKVTGSTDTHIGMEWTTSIN